eukprot:a181480_39.p1 GENE.a181480_39~~a181480_39.p1  ORF type:complete len:468 (-),score=149.01 a181480_39:28-1374(-)
MAAGQTFAVTLHVYDLSNGMARMLSPMFLGKQVEGIWHTGIVVYDEEHYFGGGLQIGRPGKTPYGAPVRVEQLGRTSVPRAEFMRWRATVLPKYSGATYHLLDNNCNHFTNDAANFLLGVGIPAYVTDLPAEFLATPFGQAMRPAIDQMMGSMGGALGESVGAPVDVDAPPGRAAAPSFVLARSRDLTRYAKANVDTIQRKLVEFVSAVDALAPSATGAVFLELRAVLAGEVADGSPELVAALRAWTHGLRGMQRFPVLDCWRILALRPEWARELADGDALWAFARLGFEPEPDGQPPSKHTLIMALRLLANSLASETTLAALALEPTRLDTTLELAVTGLCHAEPAVRQVAAAVLHNVSVVTAAEQGLTETRLRLITSATECLFAEGDPEVVFCELSVLAHCIVDCPEARELVLQLDVPFARFRVWEGSTKVNQIAEEIERILAAAP